jgi:hypothetical protein
MIRIANTIPFPYCRFLLTNFATRSVESQFCQLRTSGKGEIKVPRIFLYVVHPLPEMFALQYFEFTVRIGFLLTQYGLRMGTFICKVKTQLNFVLYIDDRAQILLLSLL